MTLQNFAPERSLRVVFARLSNTANNVLTLRLYWFTNLPSASEMIKCRLLKGKDGTFRSLRQSRDLTVRICEDRNGNGAEFEETWRRLKRTIVRHAIYFLRQFRVSAINSIEFNRNVVFLGLLIRHLYSRLPQSFRLWLQSLDSLCDNLQYSISIARDTHSANIYLPEFMTVV